MRNLGGRWNWISISLTYIWRLKDKEYNTTVGITNMERKHLNKYYNYYPYSSYYYAVSFVFIVLLFLVVEPWCRERNGLSSSQYNFDRYTLLVEAERCGWFGLYNQKTKTRSLEIVSPLEPKRNPYFSKRTFGEKEDRKSEVSYLGICYLTQIHLSVF